MKHAFLIIAHNEYPVLEVLLSMLDDERNDIYLHIDKRATELFQQIKKGEFYQFNLSSCIRQQNSLTAQFVSFSLANLANIFYPPRFLQ